MIFLPFTSENQFLFAFPTKIPNSSRKDPVRLLVADDHRDGADSLKMLLELQGFQVEVAYDGPSAIERALSYLPKMIILDLGMPKMDGYEVVRQIRQFPQLQGVVLVALTGWTHTKDERTSREAGFDFHLIKPTDPDTLEMILTPLRNR